jgi:hypothetical protein
MRPFFWKTGALPLTVCLALTGCAHNVQWSSPQACIAAHTAGGALAGALVGAGIGALTGKSTGKGAAIGAAGGAALAFAYAWGACFSAYSRMESKPARNYEATASEVKYRPEQGLVVEVQKFELIPSVAAPGDKLQMKAIYFVMDSVERQEIEVTEIRSVEIWDNKTNKYELLGQVPEKKPSPAVRVMPTVA